MKTMAKTISKVQSVLNTYGIVLILWSLFRFNFSGLPEWFDEFIAKPLVFVLPALVYVRRIEKKSFFKQIWFNSTPFVSNLVIGLALGAIFIISALFANFIRYGNFNIQEIVGTPSFIVAIIVTFATAFSEEVFSRGFLLKRLYEEWGNMYSAAFISSILFLVLHIPILLANLQLSGNLLVLFFATDFILSLVNSFVFLERKSLIAPILIHALYNLAILIYL